MDDRLDTLKVAEDQADYTAPIKINRIKLNNYKFFYGEFELAVNGENLLVYGENGTGKSLIYKALELLTKKEIPADEFIKNRNVFNPEGETSIEIEFTNGQEYIIDADTTTYPDYVDFLHGLSVFVPMLDYKKLLKVHYTMENIEQINLYRLFRTLLRDYEYKQNEKLSAIKDPNKYYEELTRIMEDKLLKDINNYLNKYFESDCMIDSFDCRTEIDSEDDTRIIPVVNITIDYKENSIENYHNFFNEARLSALVISIYLSTIKTLYSALKKGSLKILILDDLLISLDMSNRLKLLEILKNEFTDFQIFFFTHDKELFEIYKNKMAWNKYEIYLDDSGEIPKAILKQGKSEIERAKEYYAKKEYDACALLLRKGFEKILKAYLTPREQRNSNCEELNLSDLVEKAISKSSSENKNILEKLNSDRQHILNPLSHNDTRPIYSQKLKSAMDDLEKLKGLLLQ
ncbi:MAG: hypothetical protein KAH62_00490 [Desulfobacula sp.]|nr:hypothetical protein [Desulfobacula sp.]